MQTTIHPVSAEELMAYLDGELSAAQAIAVHKHLEACRECQNLAADLQAVSRQLGEWHIEEIAPHTELPGEKRKGPRASFGLWRWAAVVAAAAVLTMIAVLFHPAAKKQVIEADRFEPAPEQQQFGRERRFSTGAIGGVIGGVPVGTPLVPPPPPQSPAADTGPLIIRTAELKLISREFDLARDAVQQIVKQHSGYVAEMSISAAAGEARSLHASLRVPAPQLDSFLSALRRLGRVTYESQHGEDVTKQFIDLNARLENARNMEQRLTQLLRDRTGKLSDVLAVEEQIGNVRGQIETMEAERKSMSNQIAFSAADLTITEEYKASLATPGNSPIGTRLHNAAVNGYQNVIVAAVGLLSFLLSVGPVLLIAIALLFFPLRLIWRKTRTEPQA